jgi:hypothetical protein
MTTVVKTPIILKGSKDWVRWYEAVCSSVHVKEVFYLVNIDTTIQPIQLQRPTEPQYADVQ